MRQFIITGICFLFFYSVHAQEHKPSRQGPMEYFNNFQMYSYNVPNADSAFYFVQKLASNDKYVGDLRMLLHNSFAQQFVQRKISDSNVLHQQALSKEILMKMISDTTKLLLETVKPMYLWIEAQNNKNDVIALTNLTNAFIKTQLSSGDVYKNSAGRYGLMIYRIVSEHEELKSLAAQLFTTIYSGLKDNQLPATNSSSGTDLDKRAWFRYVYAYANFIKSQQTGDIHKKESYLKTAFDYSPDLIDKNHLSGYFYDKFFLFNGEEEQNFKTGYLAFLAGTDTDKTKILSLWLTTALVEPEYKNKLEEFYSGNFMTTKNFNDYWTDAVNANAKIAPPVLLYLLDGKSFSSKEFIGKWILLDFWGTWCSPCRQEHPEIQKFYDSTVSKNSKNISLMTIACKDKKEQVLAYLNERHFSFPVAMSDNDIEKTYQVQGYPTKILITPQGKYIIVPLGSDWVDFVKGYCSLR